MGTEIIIPFFCAIISLFVVFSKRTVGAIFFLGLTILGMCAIYFSLGTTYLAIINGLLFIGLIIVFYLFAFMLMHETPKEAKKLKLRMGTMVGITFIIITFLCIFFIFEGNAQLLDIKETGSMIERGLFQRIINYHFITYEFTMVMVLGITAAVVYINFENKNKKEGE